MSTGGGKQGTGLLSKVSTGSSLLGNLGLGGLLEKPFSLDNFHHEVRRGFAKYDPRQIQELKNLNIWMKEEKNVMTSLENASRERREAAKYLLLWGKGEDEDIADVTTKLSLMFARLAEVEELYADKYAAYRGVIKQIRDAEATLHPARERKRKIQEEIVKLKKSHPRSPRVHELERDVVQLDAECEPDETTLAHLKRKKLKDALTVQLEALFEAAEKTAIIAGYSKYIVDQINTAPNVADTKKKKKKYEAWNFTQSVLDDCKSALAHWTPPPADVRPILPSLTRNPPKPCSAPSEDHTNSILHELSSAVDSALARTKYDDSDAEDSDTYSLGSRISTTLSSFSGFSSTSTDSAASDSTIKASTVEKEDEFDTAPNTPVSLVDNRKKQSLEATAPSKPPRSSQETASPARQDSVASVVSVATIKPEEKPERKDSAAKPADVAVSDSHSLPRADAPATKPVVEEASLKPAEKAPAPASPAVEVAPKPAAVEQVTPKPAEVPVSTPSSETPASTTAAEPAAPKPAEVPVSTPASEAPASTTAAEPAAPKPAEVPASLPPSEAPASTPTPVEAAAPKPAEAPASTPSSEALASTAPVTQAVTATPQVTATQAPPVQPPAHQGSVASISEPNLNQYHPGGPPPQNPYSFGQHAPYPPPQSQGSMYSQQGGQSPQPSLQYPYGQNPSPQPSLQYPYGQNPSPQPSLQYPFQQQGELNPQGSLQYPANLGWQGQSGPPPNADPGQGPGPGGFFPPGYFPHQYHPQSYYGQVFGYHPAGPEYRPPAIPFVGGFYVAQGSEDDDAPPAYDGPPPGFKTSEKEKD